MSAGKKTDIREDVGRAEHAIPADKMCKPTFCLFQLKNYTLLIVLVLGVISIFTFRDKLLLLVGDFLVIQDDLHPADVIHVIAGDDYRTDYAIQLYKQGYGKALFFTGGWCKYHNYFHGAHAEERSLTAGVPLHAIDFDDAEVISTYMEAERLKEWISHRPSPIHSVIVVSDPFQMRRALWTYKRVLGDGIDVQMAPVPYELTPYIREWWTNRQSQNYVRDEYEKYLYYILRYQISHGKFQEWLVSLDRE